MTGCNHQERVNTYFDRSARYWNDIYALPDVYALIQQERKRLVLDLVDGLSLPAGAAVLEIGCGAGHIAVELARRGFQVSAIDSAARMLAATVNRSRQIGVEHLVNAGPGNAESLRFADGEFALVLAIGVFPWLDSLDRALAEMARVTRPGGFVLTTIDHRWGLNRLLDPRINPAVLWMKHRLINAIAGARALRAEALCRTHSMAQLDTALRKAGLEKQKGTCIGFGPFTFLNMPLLPHRQGFKLHRRLQRLADRGTPMLRSAGAQYVVLAQRMDAPRR